MRSPGHRVLRVTLVGVLVLAVALRLADFLEMRPLWLDEASLALGIGRFSFGALTGTLPYDQSAPILFLWGTKIVTLIGGMSEGALRLIPLLAGLALPWLVWRAVKQLAGSGVALIATTLTAVSLPLIRYSAELKPYGVDAFVCVGLIALTLRVRATPDRARVWWELLAAGLVGMAASFGAPFILAGAWAALVIDPAVRQAMLGRRRLFLLTLGWGAGFTLLFVFLYLPQSASEYMQAFWGDTFLDMGAANFGARLYRASWTLTSALPAFPHWVPVKVSLALLAAGILLIVRRGKLPALALIGIPYLAVAVGAIVEHYPIATRLLLFLAPCAFIGFAVLIAEAGRLARLGETGAGVVGTVLVLIWSLNGLRSPNRLPEWFSEGRLSAKLVLQAAGAEPVYIIPGGLAVWAYYSTDWQRPDTARLDLFARVSRADGPATQNSLLPEADPNERKALTYRGRDRLELIGRRVGIGYAELRGFNQTEADSGWAKAEVDRIVEVAKPYVWLYGSYLWGPTESAIRTELSRRGIRTVTELVEGRSLAILIRVGAPPP